MKTLILFSLKRRFINPVAIALQVLFTVALIILFNLDHLSLMFDLNLTEPLMIQVSPETQSELLASEEWERQGLALTDTSQAVQIEFIDGVYQVKGPVSLTLQMKLYGLLLQSHQQTILNTSHPSVLDFVLRYNTVNVAFDQVADPMGMVRENLVFVVLTSIYFMLLNFISVNSNEIIQEKTSNILEFTLTSITPFQHFCAKILTGLITVVIQLSLSAGIFGVLLIQRLNADQGKGLLDLANKFFNLQAGGLDLEALKQVMNFEPNLILKAGISLLFLIAGLLIIQVMILILSSRVKTIEEAASIQGPFYLGLLALYYGSLMLNTPAQLDGGIGRILSFLPVSSMLVMGMRILNSEVGSYELALALSVSMVTLMALIMAGSKAYHKGLVNE